MGYSVIVYLSLSKKLRDRNGEIYINKYKINYSADVAMQVEIEANSKEEAKKLFGENAHYEQGYQPEQTVMENLNIDTIEEIT